MPELSNIQTYEQIIGRDFSPALAKFERVLKNIGAWDSATEKAFGEFNWDQDSNGFVYSSLMGLNRRTTKYSGVPIRPLVMIMTPQIDSTFNHNWISFDLLIETEELIDSNSAGAYKDYTFGLVESLAAEMAYEFTDTGIYFTNEAQDGEAFDGLRTKNHLKLWEFDYALIPIKLSDTYMQIPKAFSSQEHSASIELWDNTRWRRNR